MHVESEHLTFSLLHTETKSLPYRAQEVLCRVTQRGYSWSLHYYCGYKYAPFVVEYLQIQLQVRGGGKLPYLVRRLHGWWDWTRVVLDHRGGHRGMVTVLRWREQKRPQLVGDGV